MRKIILILLFPLSGIAQGIHFEDNANWQQAQAKAKAEHKYIFMDCYATWCGPCKYMSQNIFTQNEVGKYVNENFIAVSVQMDSTGKDDDYTKGWYADAKRFTRDYQVNSYPTYLFFDPDGHIVHRAGGAMPASAFMEVAKDALDPGKQFYPLYNKYQRGERDSAMLSQLTICSISMEDAELTSRFLADYIGHIKNVYTIDNLTMIGKLTKSTKEKGFALWLHHPEQVNAVMGKDYAQRKLINAIMAEDIRVIAANQKAVQGLKVLGKMGEQPLYGQPDKKATQPVTPDWQQMYADIKTKYGPYYADRITKWVKLNYYLQRKDWTRYDLALTVYLNAYQTTVRALQLNGYAWDIFTRSKDKKQLQTAIRWSKAAIAQSEKDPNLNQYVDTYANLLYKSGNKKAAEEQEQKALQLSVSENDKKVFEATLEKMKNGVKTWQ